MTTAGIALRFQRLIYGSPNNRETNLAFLKYSSRNIPSAVITIMVIILLSLSFCTDWFVMFGGSCNDSGLGVSPFLYSGQFIQSAEKSSVDYVYRTITSVKSLRNCISHDMYVTMKTNLTLIFLAIFCSMFQITLDLIAPEYLLLKVLQINAIGSFITTLFCTTVCGLSYWVSVLLYHLQVQHKYKPGMPVFVSFAAGFYFIVAAAALSLLAAATNCFHYPFYVSRVLSGHRRSAHHLFYPSGHRNRSSSSRRSSRRRRHQSRNSSQALPIRLTSSSSNPPPNQSSTNDEIPLFTDCSIEISSPNDDSQQPPPYAP